jgi:hypothetical protein
MVNSNMHMSAWGYIIHFNKNHGKEGLVKTKKACRVKAFEKNWFKSFKVRFPTFRKNVLPPFSG